jgi:sugar/nucleoside kinase (ribokinase family)
MTVDLLVIGDANPDVIMGPLDGGLAFGQREQLVETGTLTPGGSAAITACGAARLGLSVAFAGRVGDDDAGDYMRLALAKRGVDVAALRTDPDLPTPLTTIVTRGDDRAMLTAAGALTATSRADVPAELLAGCRHVHVGSFFLMPALAATLADLFRAAHRHGATTSLDTNDDPAGKWAGLDPVLAETDYLLPNAAESCAITGRSTVEEAAAALAARGPTVVVKNGAAGALCHTGSTLLRTSGVPVTPVDAVGAGDTFDAGFLAAKLLGRTDQQALDLAAVCGALSTLAAGGTTCQPTLADAMSCLEGTFPG